MKSKIRHCFIILIVLNIFCVENILAQDFTICAKALDEKLIETYEQSSISDYESKIYELFDLEDTQFEERRSGSASGGSIGVEYAGIGISLGQSKSASDEYKELKDIRKRYLQVRSISDNDWIFIKKRSGSNALESFNTCIRDIAENSPKEMNAKIIGNEYSTFNFIISWFPSNQNDDYTRIVSVNPVNLQAISKENIREDAIIETFTGMSQTYIRTNAEEEAALTITFEGKPLRKI